MKWTPAPWHALKYPDCKTWTVAATQSVASKIESEANAQLIAQAPAMFEALQDCLDCMVPTGQDTRTDRAMDKARAIIARVMGEPCELKRDEQFEQWAEDNLELLRQLYKQFPRYAPVTAGYQSFPDFCRQQWEERKEKVKRV